MLEGRCCVVYPGASMKVWSYVFCVLSLYPFALSGRAGHSSPGQLSSPQLVGQLRAPSCLAICFSFVLLRCVVCIRMLPPPRLKLLTASSLGAVLVAGVRRRGLIGIAVAFLKEVCHWVGGLQMLKPGPVQLSLPVDLDVELSTMSACTPPCFPP